MGDSPRMVMPAVLVSVETAMVMDATLATPPAVLHERLMNSCVAKGYCGLAGRGV